MEGCTVGTFLGYLWTEHALLSTVGIVVELVVIGFAILEVVRHGQSNAALRRASDLLHRYAGAVQTAKAIPAVAQSPDLMDQFNDLGDHYKVWTQSSPEKNAGARKAPG